MARRNLEFDIEKLEFQAAAELKSGAAIVLELQPSNELWVKVLTSWERMTCIASFHRAIGECGRNFAN